MRDGRFCWLTRIESCGREDSELYTVFWGSIQSSCAFLAFLEILSHDDIRARLHTAPKAPTVQSFAERDAETSFAAHCIDKDALRKEAGHSFLLSWQGI